MRRALNTIASLLAAALKLRHLHDAAGEHGVSFSGTGTGYVSWLAWLVGRFVAGLVRQCIDCAWLATQGRQPNLFNAVERLCYIGSRGMGALEFFPAKGPKARTSQKIQVEQLVKLASEVLTHRQQLAEAFGDDMQKAHALK